LLDHADLSRRAEIDDRHRLGRVGDRSETCVVPRIDYAHFWNTGDRSVGRVLRRSRICAPGDQSALTHTLLTGSLHDAR
jgi:hypothetical protein